MRRFVLFTLLAFALLPARAAAAMLMVEGTSTAVAAHAITADRDGPVNAGLETPSSLSTGVARAPAESKTGGMRPGVRPGAAELWLAVGRAFPAPRHADPDIPATCEELPYPVTGPPQP